MADLRQKRYQYWGRFGKEWYKWFNYNGPEEPMQAKGLKNEYRTITEKRWKKNN